MSTINFEQINEILCEVIQILVLLDFQKSTIYTNASFARKQNIISHYTNARLARFQKIAAFAHIHVRTHE